MPIELIGSVIDAIAIPLGGSPVADLPIVGGVLGPTGERGLTGPVDPGTGTGGALTVIDPLSLLADILGLPFDVVQGALETVGLSGGTGQGPGGFAGLEGAVRGLPANLQGFSRGNGRTANRTVVQTLDLMTNKIVRNRILPGTPHMMNSDIRAAKKVFRQSADLHSKMPRRTVKESETTKMKNQIVQAAVQKVICPPKCD